MYCRVVSIGENICGKITLSSESTVEWDLWCWKCGTKTFVKHVLKNDTDITNFVGALPCKLEDQ